MSHRFSPSGSRIWIHIALAWLTFVVSAPHAFAQLLKFQAGSGGFVLQNADSFYRDSDRKLMVLQGNVQVIYADQHLAADKAIIYEATQEIEAEGNLVINSSTVYVEGDRARFNYKTGEGVIYNGFVRSGQVVFEGRLVRKLGPDEYEAEAAYYTACTTCPPAWSFTGSRIRARLGGYAYIRNSVLEIAHFPVLWLPYLIVPLKSDRQTGLLIPSLDLSGNGGTAISQSFFWAIDRSTDATFTLKNYSFRGLKGLANYRYILSENSQGEFNVGGIQDRVFAGDPAYLIPGSDRPTKFTRWFFTTSNVYDLPEGFVQRSHVTLVSDLRYPRDFFDEVGGWGDPALENRLSLTKNLEQTHSSLELAHYTNMLKSDPIADNADAVHRLPELRYSLIDRQLAETGITFRMDAKYTNFAREDFAYDDVAGAGATRTVDITRGRGGGNGIFDATETATQDADLIRSGQRLDLQPELSRPFLIGRAADILPVLTLRHTQYAFDITAPPGASHDKGPSRQYIQARVTGRTRFSRVYGIDPDVLKDDRLKHEIEPVLSVATLPYSEQSQHRFFGTTTRQPLFQVSNELVSDADFRGARGVQFDYFDRTPSRSVVSYGLNNRLIQKRWAGDAPDYRQIVNLRISQSYDLDEGRRTTSPRYPWSDIATLLDIKHEHFETSMSLQYFPYHNVTNNSTRIRLIDRRGDYLELRYSQAFAITENLQEDYRGRNENVGFGAGFQVKYATVAASMDTEPRRLRYIPDPTNPNAEPPSALSLKVKNWSANVTLRPPGDCWAVLLKIDKAVGADPSFKGYFEYNFGGSVL
ncbi:MAG: LPS assembly protein LptD [Bdellovibrionaceae bacterium]|nr:LPS assembly protein LptD [Pseudobdellovibrionaceae bacterium]